MGKQAGPSPEELELIFNCFARGLSDREVLDEIQDTEFPVRNPRFMRERRREFNATRKVLEVTLEQQIDPTLVKAKEEHNAEIRALIEQWKSEMKTPRIDEMFLSVQGEVQLNYSTHDYQFNPLFECLREHIPVDELWGNYDQWKDKMMKYFQKCANLIKIIEQDAKVVRWLNENPEREANIIVNPILRCINDKAHGVEPDCLNIVNPETGNAEPYMEVTQKPESTKFIKRSPSEKTQEVQGIIDKVYYVDPEICKCFYESEEANEVAELYNELQCLTDTIIRYLDEALIRRDYIKTRCSLCPA